jgi:NitT/TauT family transport system permease protein
VGNFIAALPIVGTAPILVMWFGFGWQSKAAVVVVMVFFPMLVNCVQGLKASEPMQRDLMHTYAASYWQSLLKLRLPTALPFIFNGLKICTTLALIGAIVAEFFGSPTWAWAFASKSRWGAWPWIWSGPRSPWPRWRARRSTGLWPDRARLTFWHPSQRTG